MPAKRAPREDVAEKRAPGEEKPTLKIT